MKAPTKDFVRWWPLTTEAAPPLNMSPEAPAAAAAEAAAAVSAEGDSGGRRRDDGDSVRGLAASSD